MCQEAWSENLLQKKEKRKTWVKYCGAVTTDGEVHWIIVGPTFSHTETIHENVVVNWRADVCLLCKVRRGFANYWQQVSWSAECPQAPTRLVQKDRHSLLKIPGNLHIIKVAIKSAATIWREKRENRDISNSPNITDSSEKMSYCRNL